MRRSQPKEAEGADALSKFQGPGVSEEREPPCSLQCLLGEGQDPEGEQ